MTKVKCHDFDYFDLLNSTTQESVLYSTTRRRGRKLERRKKRECYTSFRITTHQNKYIVRIYSGMASLYICRNKIEGLGKKSIGSTKVHAIRSLNFSIIHIMIIDVIY
jgi:hypothetical protein